MFCGALREAIEATVAAGDSDLGGVDVGRIFLEGLFMLRAFESYCTRQVCASLCLHVHSTAKRRVSGRREPGCGIHATLGLTHRLAWYIRGS